MIHYKDVNILCFKFVVSLLSKTCSGNLLLVTQNDFLNVNFYVIFSRALTHRSYQGRLHQLEQMYYYLMMCSITTRPLDIDVGSVENC